jgi:hypothetical protein
MYMRNLGGQGIYWACQPEFRKYNTGMAKKAGRPTRDPSGEASKIVPIRLTDSERINYQKSAERCGQSLSEWIRERLDRAAKREAKEA